jgi:site-specific recombinase XerD
MRYAATRDIESLPSIQQVLAIPLKRFDRPLLEYLTQPEMEAILSAPDLSTWSGHRDFVMLSTFYNTGARVSEIIGLRTSDVSLDSVKCVRIYGKGRKERVVPLWKSTVKALKQWLPLAVRAGSPGSPLFPNRTGAALSRSGVEKRLAVAVKQATRQCPSLKGRRLSPHVLRHTTAMHLLQSGVDITVIALWLGHESPATTHLYVEANLAMKERALSMLQEPAIRNLRYRPNDRVLAFLDSL